MISYAFIHNKKKQLIRANNVDQAAKELVRFKQSVGEELSFEQAKASIKNQLRTNNTIDEARSSLKFTSRVPKLGEAYSASMALFRYAKGEMVDQEELDRRTKICMSCPMRQKASFCAGCGGLGKATNFLNDTRRLTRKKLKFNDRIKTEFCGVCGCALPLLLATKKESLPKDSPSQANQRPEFCWMK